MWIQRFLENIGLQSVTSKLHLQETTCSINVMPYNISATSWQSATHMLQVTDELHYIMLYRVHLAMSRMRTRNFSGNYALIA
jgi:hypothetical protein